MSTDNHPRRLEQPPTREELVQALQYAVRTMQEGLEVRAAQRAYFVSRHHDALVKSKQLESTWDRSATFAVDALQILLQREGVRP